MTATHGSITANLYGSLKNQQSRACVITISNLATTFNLTAFIWHFQSNATHKAFPVFAALLKWKPNGDVVWCETDIWFFEQTWSWQCWCEASTGDTFLSIASDLVTKWSAIRRVIEIHHWLMVTTACWFASNHGQWHKWSSNYINTITPTHWGRLHHVRKTTC